MIWKFARAILYGLATLFDAVARGARARSLPEDAFLPTLSNYPYAAKR